jgi:hypothetical protein
MARTVATNFTSTLQFPKATAATDLFKKEDVQTLAEAVDQHDHSAGKGVVVNVAGIAAGAINGSQITDNTITSAKITDGTIATADLANAAVTNVKLASDTARANLLTNGGFEVWQRGNGPFTTAYTADRWGWKTSTANAVRIRTYDGTTIGSGTYHSGSGAYQTLTLTTTFSAAPTVAWFGVEFDASCTAYLDNAMLVVGSQAADYAPLHPADDLARCLRYYETIGSPGMADVRMDGYGTAAMVASFCLPYKAVKAVTGTVTKVGTWTTSNCVQPTFSGGAINSMNVGTTVTAAAPFAFYNAAGGYLTIEANP